MLDPMKHKAKAVIRDAEKYLAGFFAEIPDSSLTRSKDPPSGNLRADVYFQLRRRGQRATLLLEAKASAEPRIVATWLDRFPGSADWPKGCYPVLCAPHISDAAGVLLKARRIGYIDLSGNCWLDLGFLFVERSGRPNRFKTPKEQRVLFTARASRILRTLLEDPGKAWTLQALARTAGVSVGLAHRMSKALEEHLFAEKRRARFALRDPGGLLDAWRSFYTGQRTRWQRYYWPTAQDIHAGMQVIAKSAGDVEIRYAFTGPAAASLLVPYLLVSGIHCYIEALKPGLLDALKAGPVASGGNLWFNVMQREDIFLGSHLIDGLHVVGDVQMYLDLCSLGSRGAEAAETLRERRLRY